MRLQKANRGRKKLRVVVVEGDSEESETDECDNVSPSDECGADGIEIPVEVAVHNVNVEDLETEGSGQNLCEEADLRGTTDDAPSHTEEDGMAKEEESLDEVLKRKGCRMTRVRGLLRGKKTTEGKLDSEEVNWGFEDEWPEDEGEIPLLPM